MTLTKKIFAIHALAFITLASLGLTAAHASEVTGTLSTGTTDSQVDGTVGGSVDGSVDGGTTIGGTVTGGSGGSGGSSGGGGSVAGATITNSSGNSSDGSVLGVSSEFVPGLPSTGERPLSEGASSQGMNIALAAVAFMALGWIFYAAQKKQSVRI